MNFEKIQVGMKVFVNKEGSPYHREEGAVLSTRHEITGEENIRLRMDETGEIITSFKASELT